MINKLDPINTDLVAPKVEPLVSTDSVIFFALNIFTLGIYGSVIAQEKTRHYRHLKMENDDLQRQAQELLEKASQLETQSLQLLNSSQPDHQKTKKDLHDQLAALKTKRVVKYSVSESATYSQTVSEIFQFVGQLLANWVSLGLYGVYCQHELGNEANHLGFQNKTIQVKLDQTLKVKTTHIENLFELAKKRRDLEDQLTGIAATDAGQSFQRTAQAKADADNVTKNLKKFQTDVNALKTQKLFADQDLNSAKLRQDKTLATLEAEKQLHKKYLDEQTQTAKDVQKKEQELDNFKKGASQALNLSTVKNIVETRLKNFKEALNKPSATDLEVLTQVDKLQAQVGPIAPKYQKKPTDGESSPLEKYHDRYKGERTAKGVFVKAFQFAFTDLLEKSDPTKVQFGKPKLELNNSKHLPETVGVQALYRNLVLDLIKGSKVVLDKSKGYVLKINDKLTLIPSSPERILKLSHETTPALEINFRNRDEFTPLEANALAGNAALGHDAVAAKWILKQLSKEEENYLFALLMDPLIDNKDRALQNAKDFMTKKGAPERVELIKTALELMIDMASLISQKYALSEASSLWGELLDMENDNLKPYVKQEDKTLADLADIGKKGNEAFAKANPFEKVNLDKEILGKGSFFKMIDRSVQYNQVLFKYLKAQDGVDIVKVREKPGTIFNPLPVLRLGDQYYFSHEMIGNYFDPTTGKLNEGTQHCLFSNLLTVLVTNKSDITEENAMKLRKSMALYLDKLMVSKGLWESIKDTDIDFNDKGNQELKKLAELADYFQNEIQTTHQLSIENFQSWLRGNYYFGPKIDMKYLTPLSIELAAYTIGVKIGLIPTELPNCVSTVNNDGLIVPKNDDVTGVKYFFGPNTENYFLMSVSTKTYGGLFLKLNLLPSMKGKEISKKDYEALEKLQNFGLSVKS